ncbi:MAG: ParB/RepB/Spo0J family partition protein [Thermodesulforhabdaceae bacterium]
MEKKKGLGKSFKDVLSSPADWMFREDFQVFFCPVENLEPNPHQPRSVIEDQDLEELAASIAEKGVLQPLIVTRSEEPGHYRIIAGERRWRAAQKVGIKEVPVILKDATPSDLLEIALIENIQRKDLSCIEEALAYAKLQKEFGLSQQEIARRVGKSRSAVANTLRLLSLPQPIQEDILNGRLSMGHARAIMAIPSEQEQLAMRDKIIRQGLSVRAVENMVYQQFGETTEEENNKSDAEIFTHADDILLEQENRMAYLEKRLRSILGMNVRIRKRGKTSGQVLIFFRSEEELNRLIERLQTIQVEQGDHNENSSN